MMVDLATAIDKVFDTAYEQIKAAAKSDKRLSSLKSVIKGDRTAGNPQVPCLWVMMGDCRNTHNASFREEWIMELHLVAIVNMQNDKAAYEATRLANAASSVLIRDRRLGLAGIVQDVKRANIFTQPARGPTEGSGLYAVDVQVNVTVNIQEMEC